MKRLALVGWLIGTFGLWLVVVFCIGNFILSRTWYEIPIGFYEVVNNSLLWVVRKFKPSYDPGVLQMEDPGLFVLLGVTCLISATIVIPISVFAWRRILSPRLH
jgi:hypothetical protein